MRLNFEIFINKAVGACKNINFILSNTLIFEKNFRNGSLSA